MGESKSCIPENQQTEIFIQGSDGREQHLASHGSAKTMDRNKSLAG